MITQHMLRKDDPKVTYVGENVNCVLALAHKGRFADYLPRWHVVNAVYFQNHRDKFVGWIELERVE
jgi:hypothetical protein